MVIFCSVLLRKNFLRIVGAVGVFNKGMICRDRDFDPLKLSAISCQGFEEINISHFQSSLYSSYISLCRRYLLNVTVTILKHFLDPVLIRFLATLFIALLSALLASYHYYSY
jgi:hypothetical protein